MGAGGVARGEELVVPGHPTQQLDIWSYTSDFQQPFAAEAATEPPKPYFSSRPV